MRQPKGVNYNQCEEPRCFKYAPFNSLKMRPRRYCLKCEKKHTEKLKRKGLMQKDIDDRLMA